MKKLKTEVTKLKTTAPVVQKLEISCDSDADSKPILFYNPPKIQKNFQITKKL
jgi:hypothetical protein